ncbi:hypothetical protein W97_06953 [Coniosporium apollinis CBS 100218]|uniref:PH domain-containing protein n=1 Tax=Coniosporium apollinis (strain CBS 100218) TaxID=1168221 RepID=R7Z089_CONA1|nr:uncharacterized protein W97_06953 [Coniosporium apollinis CBS 100218]EON67585.1 hypothetical protein W97_06953 [Coniosporium apollinis CBS 100218]
MAEIEQLEVHSRSYLIRWVNVPSGHTISWTIQPHKKSLNFGVFKHPGGHGGLAPNLPPSSATLDPPPTPGLENATRPRGMSNAESRNDKSRVIEKLQALGMKCVAWAGKVEADKASTGKYDVPEGEGGMYGLVFDNTFSKQVSKTATFVVMTYPTSAPPRSGQQLRVLQAPPNASTISLAAQRSPGLPAISDSTESLPQETRHVSATESRPRSAAGTDTDTRTAPPSTCYTGVLWKKRRKKNQTPARRFFSLDFTSSTLSYYHNRHSSALRGAIPLALAAVSANEKTREISIDSGAEVWHLRASNKKDFDGWRAALERAARAAGSLDFIQDEPSTELRPADQPVNPAEEREWGKVEALVGRVAGTRDAVRRLAKDTDPKYLPAMAGIGAQMSNGSSAAPSPSETGPQEYFKDEGQHPEKLPFWKRKASSSRESPSGLFRRSLSAQHAVPPPSNVPPVPALPPGTISLPKRQHRHSQVPPEDNVHERCMAILRDLDTVVEEFSALIAESKARRLPPATPAVRNSIDSGSSDEFFDAPDGETMRSQILTMRRDSDETEEKPDEISEDGSDSSSGDEGLGSFDRQGREGQPSLFPPKPKSLTPLPLDPVPRRKTVPSSRASPPSLIGFLKKNVGKDLSTVAMPVSANEPTSLLQRVAEQLEYSELLDAAASAPVEFGERLLYITAFAISSFSNSRAKERAIRKPFNPMLGETFELVREDKGFRFVAEKVSHRPVRMACQAESEQWTFLQSPMPVQKFWGKSAELNTDGRVRVFLHATNEHYSWVVAKSFLRNIIAGEKYVEPVETMTIVNETTGAKALVTFKAGGMFAGRSEEVTVQAFGEDGEKLPLGLIGKWTDHLNLTRSGADTGKTIWSVGALVDDPAQHFGFTTFAASLNEITPVEENELPPTDSRLRPDQRAAENGDLDRAEALKARLEERQRARRRVMEEHGEAWQPRWFAKASPEGEAEEVWRLVSGKEGYWEERSRGEWSGVMDVFQG